MDEKLHWPPLFEEIVRSNLGLGPDAVLSADSSLPDLGLDSLSAVNLSVDLEEAFALLFPDDVLIAATFLTAGSLWAAVRKEQDMQTADRTMSA